MLVMDNLNRLQNSGQDIIFVKRQKTLAKVRGK
jgi:hypothetical protein